MAESRPWPAAPGADVVGVCSGWWADFVQSIPDRTIVGEAMTDTLQSVFDVLRERMVRARGQMNVAKDEQGNLVLTTPWVEPGKQEPAWFGAVQLKKNYVSCHLMPLYCLPYLREEIPTDLLKRMQGKSCFNFKKDDPELFDALEHLIANCAVAYSKPIVPKPH